MLLRDDLFQAVLRVLLTRSYASSAIEWLQYGRIRSHFFRTAVYIWVYGKDRR